MMLSNQREFAGAEHKIAPMFPVIEAPRVLGHW